MKLILIIVSIVGLICGVLSDTEYGWNFDVQETTTEKPEGCLTIHNCCQRSDEEECVVYCEPVIECPTTQKPAGLHVIAAPCRKGLRKTSTGKCSKVF
jgi:hypothetical protein